MKLIALLITSLTVAGAFAAANKVSFANVKDGQTIAKEFTVKFAVDGKKIRNAGEDPTDQATGHHHLIIDGEPVAAGMAIPTDETHLHFGKGQTEATLKLTPGKHKLTLQFADGAHRSYGPEMSKTISVTVK